MIPLHEVHDKKKVQQLAEGMERDGWVGVPLVKWEVYGDLLTGTHRYAAARSLGWSDGEIPMIDISNVFEEAELDFEVVAERHGNPYLTDDEFLRVIWELPSETREKYGLDMH